MTPELLTLFDAVDAVARHSDPATSHQAAASMDRPTLGKQRLLILRYVANGCLTSWQIVERALWVDGRRIQQNVAARRLTDLHEMGLIAPLGYTLPGSTGRQLTCWALTHAGREALAS